jgi:hypothetical protein
MTQPGAPSASPPDLPAQSGQDRAADSKIVATWFAENLSSQDGAWLATSSSRTSLAASPPLMRCVYLKQWTQTGAIVVEPSHHESTDPRLSASHAARCVAPPRRALPPGAGCARWRVLDARRVERRAPAALVVPGQLEVEALTVHAHGDVADVGPGVEPAARRTERAIVRGHRARGEAKCCSQELAAWVEHGLFNYLVRLREHGLRDREIKGFGRLEVDDQLAHWAGCRARARPPPGSFALQQLLNDVALELTVKTRQPSDFRGNPPMRPSRPAAAG